MDTQTHINFLNHTQHLPTTAQTVRTTMACLLICHGLTSVITYTCTRCPASPTTNKPAIPKPTRASAIPANTQFLKQLWNIATTVPPPIRLTSLTLTPKAVDLAGNTRDRFSLLTFLKQKATQPQFASTTYPTHANHAEQETLSFTAHWAAVPAPRPPHRAR